MGAQNLDTIAAEVRSLRKLVEKLSTPPLRVPVLLREAAKVCHVDKAWLLERVQLKDIQGYRATADSPWRVCVEDVLAYLTKLTNVTVADVRRETKLKALVGGRR